MSDRENTIAVMPEKKSWVYEYPRPAVTTDIVVLKETEKGQTAELLLIKRANHPYKDCWAIVGGFLDMDESLLECAKRELEEETGVRVPNLTFIGVYDAPDRDPRGRTLTHVYGCIIRRDVEVIAGNDAKEAGFFPLDKLPRLAFDHEQIVKDAVRIMAI